MGNGFVKPKRLTGRGKGLMGVLLGPPEPTGCLPGQPAPSQRLCWKWEIVTHFPVHAGTAEIPPGPCAPSQSIGSPLPRAPPNCRFAVAGDRSTKRGSGGRKDGSVAVSRG